MLDADFRKSCRTKNNVWLRPCKVYELITLPSCMIKVGHIMDMPGSVSYEASAYTVEGAVSATVEQGEKERVSKIRQLVQVPRAGTFTFQDLNWLNEKMSGSGNKLL